MKTSIKSIFFMVMFAVLAGIGIGTATALPVLPLIGGLAALSFIPQGETGTANAGVYKEIWTGEMLKRFTHTAGFLGEVSDYSRFVENDVIHLVDVGAHPEVLINNTTYPLVPQSLADGDVGLSLDKFETVPSSITDDELYAISYNKMQYAMDIHREALEMKTGDKAAHAFAPASDTADTPIVKTSGADNGAGFKKMTIADLIALKKKFDDMGAPIDKRILVLSTQHVQDLLLVSESFQKQYQDITTGRVLNQYGFRIYEHLVNPVYDNTFVKKAFGAAPAVTDRISSFAFITTEMFKARGSVKAFMQRAEDDVLMKRNLLSYNLRFVALPKKQYAMAAIVNETA